MAAPVHSDPEAVRDGVRWLLDMLENETSLFRRIPWWVWLGLLPGVLIGLNEMKKGGRERVNIIGAGPLFALENAESPPGARYYVDTRVHEPIESTRRRIEATFQVGSPVLVFGLDAEEIRDEASMHAAKKAMLSLMRGSAGRAIVSIVVGLVPAEDASEESRSQVEALAEWWRTEACREGRRQICVDISPYAQQPPEIVRAVDAAVRDALGRLRSYRVSTQVGR